MNAGICRVCGCTDLDCSGCIARTGAPCYWIEPDLCSACYELDEDSPCVEADCDGRYAYKPPEDCSCHVSPPCVPCLKAPLACDTCGHVVDDIKAT